MKKNTNNSSLVVVLPCPRPLIGPYSYIFFNTAVFLIPPFFAGPENGGIEWPGGGLL